MILILVFVVTFAMISIYLFLKAEKLQKELLLANRFHISSQKESKVYMESMIIVAKQYEGFAKERLYKTQTTTETIQLLTPLINNYSIIVSECIQGKDRLQLAVKKCYQVSYPEGYQELITYINRQDKQIKRFWGSNSLTGYISLVEALLTQQENHKLDAA